MAPKTKIEQSAETAKQIADAIEAAIGAWSGPAAIAFKGIRKLVQTLKNRGVISEEEAADFEADFAASVGFVDDMEARAAEYRRRRAAEQAADPAPNQ